MRANKILLCLRLFILTLQALTEIYFSSTSLNLEGAGALAENLVILKSWKSCNTPTLMLVPGGHIKSSRSNFQSGGFSTLWYKAETLSWRVSIDVITKEFKVSEHRPIREPILAVSAMCLLIKTRRCILYLKCKCQTPLMHKLDALCSTLYLLYQPYKLCSLSAIACVPRSPQADI